MVVDPIHYDTGGGLLSAGQVEAEAYGIGRAGRGGRKLRSTPTAYVLAAGASRHAGYPVCSDLWPRMINWTTKNPSSDSQFQQATDLVSRLNGPVSDLEELFTNLTQGGGPFAQLGRNELDNVTRSIRSCIQVWFQEICKLGHPATSYAALANLLARGMR